jgi:hypothetical protein
LDPDIPSEFTGEWTEESAVAWNDMWHCKNLLFYQLAAIYLSSELKYSVLDGATGISDDKLPLLNKSISMPWARFEEDAEMFPGRVKALFEGFHRLHCVVSTFIRHIAKLYCPY